MIILLVSRSSRAGKVRKKELIRETRKGSLAKLIKLLLADHHHGNSRASEEGDEKRKSMKIK